MSYQTLPIDKIDHQFQSIDNRSLSNLLAQVLSKERVILQTSTRSSTFLLCFVLNYFKSFGFFIQDEEKGKTKIVSVNYLC